MTQRTDLTALHAQTALDQVREMIVQTNPL